MNVRWITDVLGTSAGMAQGGGDGVVALDVRDLVDKAGNSRELIEQKITSGVDAIRKGKRVIVCCDYGISRSNAIAAGILAKLRELEVDIAARDVIAATGGAEIKLELLNIVRAVVDPSGFEEGSRAQPTGPVLVTGGHGFLGQPIVKKLQQMDVPVTAPAKGDLDLLVGRAQLDMLARSQRIARVIHLANPRVYTSNLALGETIAMLRNVLEVCALNRLPLVYLSGWEVYSGYRTTNLFADETLPLLPAGPYGETKFLAETLINQFRARGELRCTIMRLSPVYGAGGERPKFIRTFVENARGGKPIVTHCYANGRPALDLLHIDDATAAICQAAMLGYSGDLNIGTGYLTTTRQVAEWVVGWTKSDSRVEAVSLGTDTACIAMDSSRAKMEIGWEPTIAAIDGLRQLVEALR